MHTKIKFITLQVIKYTKKPRDFIVEIYNNSFFPFSNLVSKPFFFITVFYEKIHDQFLKIF
jgi:hypothetical protein